VERVDEAHLPLLRAVRAQARERAWAAGGGPELSGGLTIDIESVSDGLCMELRMRLR
jgi:hypothetical protein